MDDHVKLLMLIASDDFNHITQLALRLQKKARQKVEESTVISKQVYILLAGVLSISREVYSHSRASYWSHMEHIPTLWRPIELTCSIFPLSGVLLVPRPHSLQTMGKRNKTLTAKRDANCRLLTSSPQGSSLVFRFDISYFNAFFVGFASRPSRKEQCKDDRRRLFTLQAFPDKTIRGFDGLLWVGRGHSSRSCRRMWRR
jgi:hypothetical protein